MGFGLQGKAVDPGGLGVHLVDDVAVDVEGGRIAEGYSDLVEFDIGPDPFLGFIKDAVGQFVRVLAQDAGVEVSKSVAVVPEEGVELAVFHVVGFDEVGVEAAQNALDDAECAQGKMGAETVLGIADEFQDEQVVEQGTALADKDGTDGPGGITLVDGFPKKAVGDVDGFAGKAAVKVWWLRTSLKTRRS